MGDRKAAMNEIITWIEKILPNGGNKAIYEEQLGQLSDEAFERYMNQLESGEETLFLVSPNLSKVRLSTERNLKVAKELGHNFFERLWLTDPHTGTTYLTPIPYLVVDLPLRRQAQTLAKKVSIPLESSKSDLLTGQPSFGGENKGASLSFPELTVLHAQGLEKSIEELIKFRGGDEMAYRAMNKHIINNGAAFTSQIVTPSRVKSTETLSIYLKSMHINNNL